MGLLDDAIREHLDLKRRHGAPAEEVQRLEHEALGPIRRGGDYAFTVPDEQVPVPAEPPEAPPFEDEHGDPATAESPVAAAVPLDQPVSPEPAGHEPVPEEFEPGEEPAAIPAGDAVEVREATPPEPPAKTGSFVDEELWLDDPSSEEAPPEDLLEPPGQETTAFSAADVAAAQGVEPADAATDAAEPQDEAPAPPVEEEDVLEETPDFLQETPEHDRLWFEQRPPRGFDFEQ